MSDADAIKTEPEPEVRAPAKADSKEEVQNENIFMFIPNLIGYARIFLALFSFWFMPTNYVMASSAYLLSGLLDAFDGHAARTFNQSTTFGAMLDMLTDRCATMALLATLCTFYPSWMFFFQLSMVIDVSCHWIHLHTTLLQGKMSHKFMDASANPLMKLYYTSRPVLFGMCAGNEIFYASLYLLHFTSGPLYFFYITAVLSFPVAIAKLGISCLHGYLASLNLAIYDNEQRRLKGIKSL